MVGPSRRSRWQDNDGVTEAVYHAWLRQNGKPICPVRQITRADAEQIYFEQYWVPCDGTTLAAGVDPATYDASVNSGVSRGRKWLLTSIGGPDYDTVKRICAKRLGFMQSLNI
jgi:lysozyme family protein